MLQLHLAFKVPVSNYGAETLTPIARVKARLWSATIPDRKYRAVVEAVALARHMDVASVMVRGDFDRHFKSCARHEVMWRLREMGHSYPAIRKAMGYRCHTSILYGVRQHEARLAAEL